MQVLYIIVETLNIDLCTGIFLIEIYWYTPNRIPIIITMKPHISNVEPSIPRAGKKLSFIAGIGKSASLAMENNGRVKIAKRDRIFFIVNIFYD